MSPLPRIPFLLVSLTAAVIASAAPKQAVAPVPAPAHARVAATQVRVAPDRADWTYRLGEPARSHVSVTWDEQPLEGIEITYSVGPEMMPTEERTARLSAEGLVIDGGTLTEPG